MTVVMVTGCKHSYEVDCQSTRADQKQLLCIHLRRIDEPLNSLEHDKDGDQDEKDPIGKATERLHACVAVTTSASS